MDFIIDDEIINTHNRYLDIMKWIKDDNINVSSNSEFQKAFSRYYFPAPVSADFKKQYFSYMQQCRNCASVPSYREILEQLRQFSSGAVHYSFASKFLHTLDENSPILDQHIMRLLGFKIITGTRKTPGERISYYCNVLGTVSAEYQSYKDAHFMQVAIEQFDNRFPAFKDISYTKKVDMLLFRLRDLRGASVLDCIANSYSLDETERC